MRELLTFDDPATPLPAMDRPGGHNLYRRVPVPIAVNGDGSYPAASGPVIHSFSQDFSLFPSPHSEVNGNSLEADGKRESRSTLFFVLHGHGPNSFQRQFGLKVFVQVVVVGK